MTTVVDLGYVIFLSECKYHTFYNQVHGLDYKMYDTIAIKSSFGQLAYSTI